MGFPEGFLWGVSESGFQFEMGDPAGRNVDANTDWFVWVHDAENIRRGIVSGDLPENGVDYWNLYVKDHEEARRLGLNAYRIGVEWSRIFPKNTAAVTESAKSLNPRFKHQTFDVNQRESETYKSVGYAFFQNLPQLGQRYAKTKV